MNDSGLRTTVRMGILALLWGSCFLWIKLALTGFSPVLVTVFRCALGAAVLLGIAAWSRQTLPRDRRIWGRLLIAAFFCNALPFALFSIGEQTMDSGIAGVLNATTPLWSALIGLAIGTDRGMGRMKSLGLLLGFGGVLLIFAPWGQSGLLGWGALALAGAAASYAVAFAYMARVLTGKGIPPMALAAAQLSAATALSTLALPVSGDEPPETTPVAIIALVMLGVFGTGATFAMHVRLIADVGATGAATVTYLLPVVSVGLGAIVLSEPLNTRVIAGMAVVLLGVALTRSRAIHPKPVAAPEATRHRPATHAGPRTSCL